MRRIFLIVFCLLVAAVFATQIAWRVSQTQFYGAESHSASQINVGSSQFNNAQVSGITKDRFPRLSGRVVDNAGMLSTSQRTSLEASLKEFEQKSSDQIVVATIASLEGQNLEDYANSLFRHWQLGQAKENNGVLLLIARNERKIRIEVGYGLEGTLTDAFSSVIINQVIVPRFKAGDFGEGITKGAEMILRVLSGDTAELEARKKRNPSTTDKAVEWGVWIFLFIWGVMFFGPLGFAILAPIFGEKLSKYKYRWLGVEVDVMPRRRRRSSSSGWSGGSSGGWSGGSSGGGFSGGGGSSGGGGASGGW
ncbi:MAG: TPM domain-containing protein [Salaquimonas sp.]